MGRPRPPIGIGEPRPGAIATRNSAFGSALKERRQPVRQYADRLATFWISAWTSVSPSSSSPLCERASSPPSCGRSISSSFSLQSSALKRLPLEFQAAQHAPPKNVMKYEEVTLTKQYQGLPGEKRKTSDVQKSQ